MSSTGIRKLTLADNSQIHQGDKRKVIATVTDSSDAAAEPTQIKITFTPPSGSSNATTYAKTISGSEVALTKTSDGIWYAEHYLRS
jgi:hypothetical protein